MSESKTLNTQVPTSEHLESVEYLCSIELRDEVDDQAEANYCTVAFDAIPTQILPFLHHARSREILSEPNYALSFLLMEAEIPKPYFERVIRGRGWCSITVAESSNAGEGFFKATALEFYQDETEFAPTTLYVKINSWQPDTSDLKALKRVTECRHYPSKAVESLAAQKADVNDVFVAVYDVGQANMCAIIDDNCNPKAFFDFGWPISAKRKSAPICRDFDPLDGDDPYNPSPVFLSHLDWDHWGYAYASGRPTRDTRGFWRTEVTYRDHVLERPWIMRRPSQAMQLGISHAHLLYQLQKTILRDGSPALNFWPSTRTQANWGACVLFTCNPAPGTHDSKYLRNNSALGMLVENPQSPYYQRVLLCGDADYTSIGSRYKRNLGGIVAPHHGGRVTPNSIPAPGAHNDTYRYMVFSTHQGSYSQIPSADTIEEAEELGWTISRTDARKECWCGHGERRNRWFSLSITPAPTCFRHCTCCCT
ncbi:MULTISPECIES: hypothetical protein [unclassified Pseudomonas]|uniref:hypothetical protein n=1 Tax=unclassified Pseudomonas TaxID=196821 RepID=UPI000F73DEF4|nr:MULTISPECIES: hypothetical protein [unclassified Pseudomonas]